MGLFNFKNIDLAKAVDDTVKNVQSAAGQAARMAEQIQMPDLKKASGDMVKAVGGAVDNTVKNVQSAAARAGSIISRDGEARKKPGRLGPPEAVSCLNALRSLYYLAYADGSITPDELEKLDFIGNRLLEDYDRKKDELIRACQTDLEDASDLGSPYEISRECIEQALFFSDQDSDSQIRPLQMILYLLALGYSDGVLDESEEKIIRSAARRLNIEAELVQEMQQHIKAMLAIEKEIEWIEKTDRPYLQIHAEIEQLEKRMKYAEQALSDLAGLQEV